MASSPFPLPKLENLIRVVARLRDPDAGCPWDLKQTHQSLKPYLLEESYELLEAIDECSPPHVREELGDVLLQVLLHAQIAQDNGEFTIEDVAETLSQKLIRRHPHVFGDQEIKTAEEQTLNWERIKAQEKAEVASLPSILADIPKHLPALRLAMKMSKRAVREGFAWPSSESLWECVMSEFEEFRHETQQSSVLPNGNFDELEDEMGDILFASVSLACHYGIDPEVALIRACQKFKSRFQQMEQTAPGMFPDKPLNTLSFEEWDALWNKAKSTLYKS